MESPSQIITIEAAGEENIRQIHIDSYDDTRASQQMLHIIHTLK